MAFHVQALDTLTLALGGSGSIDLQPLWKRRNGQFTRLVGIDLRVHCQLDQAASGGTAIPGEYLSTILNSVSLASSYEPYGMLYAPMGGPIYHHVWGRYLAREGLMIPAPDDIAAADADTPFRISIPMWFGDFEFERYEDFCLAPQGLINDSIEVTAAAAGDIDWASTGAVFEGSVTIRPYAYFTTSDEAQIPMVRRHRIVTRTTDRISLGRGRFTHVIGLSDLHCWKPNEAANGLDTINAVTIQRGGLYINLPVDPIWMSTLYGRRVHMQMGAVNLEQPTGGIYDAAAVPFFPIVTPHGPIAHSKVTDVMDAASPLVIEFQEDSVGGASKLVVAELVEMSDERAARMASELYGIGAPSIATKRIRPGNSDAGLAASKKVVLARSARAL
jgi:hypothetical protein